MTTDRSSPPALGYPWYQEADGDTRFGVPLFALEAIAALVESRTGQRYAEGRLTEVAAKAARFFREAGEETWESFVGHLTWPEKNALFDRFVETLTVGETYFFRHHPYFAAIESLVLPETIGRRQQTRQLRIWSAGCSTGEEAYSLAIVVQRLLCGAADWGVSILATDLNEAFLARAEDGLYGEESFRETDEEFKSTYFTRIGSTYKIRDEFRRGVKFRRLNLVDAEYPSVENGTAQMDLILCRNVLMYFAPDRSRKVVERLRAALVPGGWLVVGPSDPLPGLLAGFQMYVADDVLLYRRTNDVAAASSDAQVNAPTTSDVDDVRPSDRTVTVGSSREPENFSAIEEKRQDLLASSSDSACRPGLDAATGRDRSTFAQRNWHPERYYLLGQVSQARGDLSTALFAFRQALYVDQGFVPAQWAIATLHRQTGRREQERRALYRVVRSLRGRQDTDVILAEQGMTVGELSEAVARRLEEDDNRTN